MVENIQDRLKTITALCRAFNKWLGQPDAKEYQETEKALWQAISDCDEAAGLGLAVGRLVRFAVRNSYAYYIVVAVHKKDVVLAHIPYKNGYKSHIVDETGRAPKWDIESNLEWYDALKKWSNYQTAMKKSAEDVQRELVGV